MAGGTSNKPVPGSLLVPPRYSSTIRALVFLVLPFLLPFSILYRLVLTIRRRRWPKRNSARLDAPVISVGNITCGGTGKTPTVEMVVRELIDRGWNPAILSRGYGASPGIEDGNLLQIDFNKGNDEYWLLSENLPSVPHYQGRNRAACGREAIAAGADILVLDDGFQHLRLHRDADIVLLDALRPFDNGRVLPLGLLREPIGALEAADLIAVTRVELVSKERREAIVAFLKERFPDIPVLLLESRARAWQELYGETLDPGFLEGKEVCAFCGIGNPDSFELTLGELGIRLAGFKAFRDHHAYDPATVEGLGAWARERGVDTIVMTQKDAVKIPEDWLDGEGGLRWFYLGTRQSISSGGEFLVELLDKLAPRTA
ncbi:MAG: tetraacyldisaccharide 4'-kinase [Planctomycetota bacterium]|nr:tetraacyldisaccharide 4'-kinase [Planctomycetota bacterium]